MEVVNLNFNNFPYFVILYLTCRDLLDQNEEMAHFPVYFVGLLFVFGGHKFVENVGKFW
jgi:hypothetical protein